MMPKQRTDPRHRPSRSASRAGLGEDRRPRRAAEHPSLKATVYERLRDDILYGALHPGDLLTERKLAERFGVSKTPVREALMQLRQEGLVEVIRRAGYIVSQVSVEDVHSIFHLRQVLETEAASLAARRAGPDDHARLEDLRRRLQQTMAAAERRGDHPGEALRDYRRLNRSFHVAVAQASRNALLAEFVQRLMTSMERLLTRDLVTASSLHQLEQEHGPILDAIVRRDAEAATRLMAEHIGRTKDRILRTL